MKKEKHKGINNNLLETKGGSVDIISNVSEANNQRIILDTDIGPFILNMYDDYSPNQLNMRKQEIIDKLRDWKQKEAEYKNEYETKFINFKEKRDNETREQLDRQEKDREFYRNERQFNDVQGAAEMDKVSQAISGSFGGVIGMVTSTIKSGIDQLMQSKIIYVIMLGLLFFVILFVIIYFAIHGFNVFTAKSSTNKKDKPEGKENIYEINIGMLGDIFSTNSMITSKIFGGDSDFLDYKPDLEYDSSNEMYNSVVNFFKGFGKYFTYVNNFFDLGNNSLYQKDRPENKGGRCDNVLYFNCSLISKNERCPNLVKNIKEDNKVITLGKPKDIEINISDTDYSSHDISKLPPSILNIKDELTGMSLNDKKTVIIPWVSENNKYKLSCSDAYFKNNPSIKANLFYDNEETNTCSIDVKNSKNMSKIFEDAIIFSSPAQRNINSTDLSALKY